MVISALLQKAKDHGHGSRTMEQIFHKIMALRSGKEMSKRIYQPVISDVQTDDDATEEYAVHAQTVAVRADRSF